MAADKIIKLQLHKIDKIAEQKQNEIDKEQYGKYSPIFDIVYKILKKQPVLLYGGMAINEMLPKKLKIYKENVLPDIDVFCTNPEKIAKRIVGFLQKNGHPISSYGDALHEGTYKIYVDGLQVIDITSVSPATFKSLSHKSMRTSTGIKIVNPQFIRMSLHMMLSQPNDAHRWHKVFERLILFYKINPPHKCTFKQPTSTIKNLNRNMNTNTNTRTTNRVISDEIYEYIKQTDFIVFGYNEIKTFFGSDNNNIPNIKQPLIQLLVKEDVFEIATDIVEKLGHPKLNLSKVFEADDFISRHIFIYNGTEKIATLYTASACVSFIDHDGLRIASIHTIIRMYMLMLFSSYTHFKKDQDNIECLVNLLAILQYKNIGSKNKLFREFIMECYGIHKGLITLKRERLIRYAK